MSLLSILAIAVVTPLVTSWVLRGTLRAPPPGTDGSRTLVFSKRYLVMSLFTFLGGSAMVLWAALKFGFSSPADLFPFGGTLAILLLGGGWMTLDAFGTRVLVSTEGITRVSLLRAPRSMTWQQIERVSYNYLCSWLVLNATGQRPIRISRYMSGVYELMQELRDHLSPTVLSGIPSSWLPSAKKDAA